MIGVSIRSENRSNFRNQPEVRQRSREAMTDPDERDHCCKDKNTKSHIVANFSGPKKFQKQKKQRKNRKKLKEKLNGFSWIERKRSHHGRQKGHRFERHTF